jgi:hypothetical protein
MRMSTARQRVIVYIAFVVGFALAAHYMGRLPPGKPVQRRDLGGVASAGNSHRRLWRGRHTEGVPACVFHDSGDSYSGGAGVAPNVLRQRLAVDDHARALHARHAIGGELARHRLGVRPCTPRTTGSSRRSSTASPRTLDPPSGSSASSVLRWCRSPSPLGGTAGTTRRRWTHSVLVALAAPSLNNCG